MKVAIYLRVSTDDKGQDTQNQKVQLVQYCNAMGWEIVSEFEDKVSGAKSDRQMFLEMMEKARLRKFELVLFWSLDRFSREGALQTLNYLQKLSDYKVAYKSYTEQYLDSCGIFKDAIISILATIAKQERIRIIERTKAGMDRARLTGTKSGKAIGRPKIIVNRDKIVELRQAGESWTNITKRLGIKRPTAIRLYQQALPEGKVVQKATHLTVSLPIGLTRVG